MMTEMIQLMLMSPVNVGGMINDNTTGEDRYNSHSFTTAPGEAVRLHLEFCWQQWTLSNH